MPIRAFQWTWSARADRESHRRVSISESWYKTVFAKCAICHSAQPGKTVMGPSLFGIVGRRSASVEGYPYSEAMKKADKTWDEATLDTYLTDPKAFAPGTKMTFVGLPKPEDRANLIAYLETLK
jgi:cytochrome c